MGQQSAGHVFVTRGRVESYAGDAVVIPTDVRFSVREYWYPAIGVGTAGEVDDLRPDGWGSGGRLSGRSTGRPAVWFVDVGGGDVTSLGAAVREVLSDVVRNAPAPGASRLRPLVVMPLLGIGGGELEPGDVIETVLDAAESVLAEPGSPDVALVVSDVRDYAAAVAGRSRRPS